MENKRNGKIFHSKLNKCISPRVGALPEYSKKEEVVDDLHEFIIENKGRLPILYRYSPADYFNVSALLNGELYLVSANHMNDYWEGNRDWGSNYSAEESAKNVKDEQKHIYLKSFSEDENSDYMWKKYADNFNGMCVAYDFSNASDGDDAGVSGADRRYALREPGAAAGCAAKARAAERVHPV